MNDFFSVVRHDDDITLIELSGTKPTDKMTSEFAAFISDLIVTGKGAIIINISQCKFLNYNQRSVISKSIRLGNDTLMRNFHSLAFINNSAIAGFVLIGILNLASPTIPGSIFLSEEDALHWCRERQAALFFYRDAMRCSNNL